MTSIKILLGSVLVYFAVAIVHGCSSPHKMTTATSTAGHGGSGGATTAGGMPTGGAPGTGGHGGKGGSGGGPVPDAEAEESGSRIKAKRIVGDDGSKQFLTFYDSMLMVECAYQFASDGSRRCLPVRDGIAAAPYSPVNTYGDSSCSVTVLAVPQGGCVAKYLYESMGTSPQCGPGVTILRMYPVLSKVPQVYSMIGTTCTAQTGLDGYTFGPEAPPSSFVGSTIVTDP